MFQEAIKQSALQLQKVVESGAIDQYILIGGFAVARWGIARATADIDYAIKLRSASLEQVAEQLRGKFIIGDPGDPLIGSVSFELIQNNIGVPVQLIQFPLAWEDVAFQDIDRQEIDGVLVPFIDWKALVLLKLYAASALDMDDARKILEARKLKKTEKDYLISKASALRISRRLTRVL